MLPERGQHRTVGWGNRLNKRERGGESHTSTAISLCLPDGPLRCEEPQPHAAVAKNPPVLSLLRGTVPLPMQA